MPRASCGFEPAVWAVRVLMAAMPSLPLLMLPPCSLPALQEPVGTRILPQLFGGTRKVESLATQAERQVR